VVFPAGLIRPHAADSGPEMLRRWSRGASMRISEKCALWVGLAP
jgi:hypothetical protein